MRVLGGAVVGLIATGVAALMGFQWFSFPIGWAGLAVTFLVWIWAVSWLYARAQAASHAEYLGPGRRTVFALILFGALAGPESGCITGADLNVDGGLTV